MDAALGLCAKVTDPFNFHVSSCFACALLLRAIVARCPRFTRDAILCQRERQPITTRLCARRLHPQSTKTAGTKKSGSQARRWESKARIAAAAAATQQRSWWSLRRATPIEVHLHGSACRSCNLQCRSSVPQRTRREQQSFGSYLGSFPRPAGHMHLQCPGPSLGAPVAGDISPTQPQLVSTRNLSKRRNNAVHARCVPLRTNRSSCKCEQTRRPPAQWAARTHPEPRRDCTG
jgi:hypothetical protein